MVICGFSYFCKLFSLWDFSPGNGPGLLGDWRCKVTHYNSIEAFYQPSFSSLSNCPSGNVISVDYKGCNSVLPSVASFQVSSLSRPICLKQKILQCLGDWAGPGGQRYLGLLHQPPAGPHSSSSSPRYRCAVRFSMESKIELDKSHTLYVSLCCRCTRRKRAQAE